MTTSSQDLEHLKLLSIFHYVVAALAALFACLPLFHLCIGIAMVSGWEGFADIDPMAGFMGWFFIAFSSAFILTGWAFALCLFLAGRYLSQRRRYTFCLVMAGLACMFMPFGTVLGVFTIIVLLRDSVKELFGVAGPSATET
jgi:hypothetical protein